MIDHLSFYATDYDASKKFYEAALPTLGYGLTTSMVASWDTEFPTRRMCAFGPPGKSVFWLVETKQAPTPRHLAFVALSRAAVDDFHRAALSAGGRDNGPPGARAMYHPNYYGAFAFDPDGNNVEAVCHKRG